MQAIASLVAGIAGAENGTAVVRRRGTSALATTYADFAGTVLAQPTSGFVLDANGGTSVYVNELVDVVASDDAGNAVRSWTEGEASPLVEVRSLSFTGRDYTTGASAAGNPTTLQAILDLLRTSTGTTDFNVLFAGVSTSLKNAFGAIAGIFYNVMSPQFGALGDGVQDDTTPMQNCINFANSNGGGIVFCPTGLYHTTAELTIPAGVSLWGTGSSSIVVDSPTAHTLAYRNGTNSSFDEVRGIALGQKQASTGNPVYVLGDLRWLLIVNCLIAPNASSPAHAIQIDPASTTAQRILVDESSIYVGAAGVFPGFSCILASQVGPRIELRNSTFSFPLAGEYDGTLVQANNLKASNCVFDFSTATAGIASAIKLAGTVGHGPQAAITGCQLISTSASGAYIGLNASGANDATTSIVEAGNSFKNFTTIYQGLTAGSNQPKIQLFSRDAAAESTSSNVTPLVVNPDQNGLTLLTRTTNAAQTINVSVGPAGSFWTLLVFNNSGGTIAAGALTMGTGFFANTPAFPISNLATGHYAVYQFRALVVAGSGAWVPCAGALNL